MLSVQDKEVANGGTAPRMLCLDDYFVVEVEKVVTDPESGKKVKKMVIISKFSFINSHIMLPSLLFRTITAVLVCLSRRVVVMLIYNYTTTTTTTTTTITATTIYF